MLVELMFEDQQQPMRVTMHMGYIPVAGEYIPAYVWGKNHTKLPMQRRVVWVRKKPEGEKVEF